MLNPHGFFSDGDGRGNPQDTCQCAHCAGHFAVTAGVLNPANEAAWCSSCDAVVCPTCAAKGGFCERGSRHFMRAIEREEARERFAAAVLGR